MPKWYLNGCSRCGGDLFEAKAERHTEYHCLQCGNVKTNLIPLRIETVKLSNEERRLRSKWG